jgi:hypothetical protein
MWTYRYFSENNSSMRSYCVWVMGTSSTVVGKCVKSDSFDLCCKLYSLLIIPLLRTFLNSIFLPASVLRLLSLGKLRGMVVDERYRANKKTSTSGKKK